MRGVGAVAFSTRFSIPVDLPVCVKSSFGSRFCLFVFGILIYFIRKSNYRSLVAIVDARDASISFCLVLDSNPGSTAF